MAVAAVLAQQVRGSPQVTQRVAGEAERAQPGVDRAACPRRRVGGPAEQLGDPSQALGLLAEDAPQHRGRAPLAGLEDGLPAGDLPAGRDRRHDHLRVEAAERGGHDLARHLAHARAATGEVGLQLRAGHAVRVGGRAACEPERRVGRERLRGEIHPGRHRLDRVAQPAGPLVEIGGHHERFSFRYRGDRPPLVSLGI